MAPTPSCTPGDRRGQWGGLLARAHTDSRLLLVLIAAGGSQRGVPGDTHTPGTRGGGANCKTGAGGGGTGEGRGAPNSGQNLSTRRLPRGVSAGEGTVLPVASKSHPSQRGPRQPGASQPVQRAQGRTPWTGPPAATEVAQGVRGMRKAARGPRWHRQMQGQPLPLRAAQRPSTHPGPGPLRPLPCHRSCYDSRVLSGPWLRPPWASPGPMSTGELHLGPDSEL